MRNIKELLQIVITLLYLKLKLNKLIKIEVKINNIKILIKYLK